MKAKTLIYLTVMAPFILFLTGCSGNKSHLSSSGVFGELPSVTDEYTQKIDKKEAEMKEVRDINKAFALAQDEKALREEREKKFEEAFKTMKDLKIPFEQTGSKDKYEIKSLVISGVNSGYNVELEANIEFKVDIAAYGWGPQMTLTFLDENNQPVGKEWPSIADFDRLKGIKKGEVSKSKFGSRISGEYARAKKVTVSFKEKE